MSRTRPGLRPPQPVPPPPPPPGALWRWVRTRDVPRARTWRPWWLLGLVEVVTYPLPRFARGRALYLPGLRAWEDRPAREGMFVVCRG